MKTLFASIGDLITADNIALLSVAITVLIYVLSRHAEIRYKKHEDKKTQYLKLIRIMEKVFFGIRKDKKGELAITPELKQEFFDTGASLLLYGSKKIYRYYLLFREFSSNPLIKQSKYYKADLAIYIISEILVIMRKEVGLSYFNSLRNNEALAFFVNDFSSNPIARENAINAKFRIKMIKFELAVIDHTRFIVIKEIYTRFIRPIFAGIIVILKYIVVIPFGRLLGRLFPKLSNKI